MPAGRAANGPSGPADRQALGDMAAALERERLFRLLDPAFADVDVPLASTFMLSTKQGKEAYVEPVIEGRDYRFTVKVGTPPDTAAARLGTQRRASEARFDVSSQACP